MKKLNTLQHTHKSLGAHIALAERVQRLTRGKAFHRRLEAEQGALSSGGIVSATDALIEDLIAENEPLPSVLRLVCLLSQVCNGIKPKALASLETELIHAYGYDQARGRACSAGGPPVGARARAWLRP